jgi:hypothetical protein
MMNFFSCCSPVSFQAADVCSEKVLIYHIVLMKFKEGADADKIMQEIGNLKNVIPQIVSFTGGVNFSKEGLSKGFTHGFTAQFQTVADRDVFMKHPDHLKLVNDMLIPNLMGGVAEGISVFAYEA